MLTTKGFPFAATYQLSYYIVELIE